MSRSKYSQFFAIYNEARISGGMPYTYKEVVMDFTGRRTDSLKELSELELEVLCLNLKRLSTGNNGRNSEYYRMADRTRDKMRKAIISQFKSIGSTTQAAIAWAEKYGVFGVKKRFNDYDEQELWQLIRNAEQVKEDHIKSVNKKLKQG